MIKPRFRGLLGLTLSYHFEVFVPIFVCRLHLLPPKAIASSQPRLSGGRMNSRCQYNGSQLNSVLIIVVRNILYSLLCNMAPSRSYDGGANHVSVTGRIF